MTVYKRCFPESVKVKYHPKEYDYQSKPPYLGWQSYFEVWYFFYHPHEELKMNFIMPYV